MTESARRLTATRIEHARVESELRRWRARAASFELALAIEGESPELHARHAATLAKVDGLTIWLTKIQHAERALARRVGAAVEVA